jgi:CBS domain containing-hemolysin-like protein
MTPAAIILIIAAIGALICLSALLSGLETALFALKPHQLQRLEQQHPSLNAFIARFRENPRRVLNVILWGDVMINVPLVVLCLFLLWQIPTGVQVPQWLEAGAIFAIIVVGCDLVPKLFALSAPYRLSTVGVFALRALMPLLDRVGQSLESISVAIVDAVTPSNLRPRLRLSDEELETLVEISEEQGALHEAEGEMIQEIIKIGDKTAKDCMTPRVDAFAVPDDLTNEELIAQLKRERHRRVPVYGETPDDIVGVIDVELFLLNRGEHYTVTLLPPSYVAETMRALDLLKSFLAHPQGMAIVVDEFGGLEGVVTMTDIVEQIIGDAAPLGDAELYIEPLDETRLLVSGNARLDDLNEHLGFTLEAEGIDTIGGFVFNRLGYLPRSGTRLELPQLNVTVRRAARNRIEEILLEKTTCLDEPEVNGEEE